LIDFDEFGIPIVLELESESQKEAVQVMSATNPDSKPLAKGRAFAQCDKCGKKFYGPRRNAKLGGHKYQIHMKHAKRGRVKSTKSTMANGAIDLKTLGAAIRAFNQYKSLYTELSPESQTFLTEFLS
jgi:hypothetical protein